MTISVLKNLIKIWVKNFQILLLKNPQKILEKP